MPDSRWRWRIGFVVGTYWVALLIGTHWPKLPTFGPENTDKVLHISAYCGLAVLFTLFVLAAGKAKIWMRLLCVGLILAVAGGLDELTQPPFHRTADWNDWFADLAGICAGMAVAVWMSKQLWRNQ